MNWSYLGESVFVAPDGRVQVRSLQPPQVLKQESPPPAQLCPALEGTAGTHVWTPQPAHSPHRQLRSRPWEPAPGRVDREFQRPAVRSGGVWPWTPDHGANSEGSRRGQRF